MTLGCRRIRSEAAAGQGRSAPRTPVLPESRPWWRCCTREGAPARTREGRRARWRARRPPPGTAGGRLGLRQGTAERRPPPQRGSAPRPPRRPGQRWPPHRSGPWRDTSTQQASGGVTQSKTREHRDSTCTAKKGARPKSTAPSALSKRKAGHEESTQSRSLLPSLLRAALSLGRAA